jgi:hypothetical protein
MAAKKTTATKAASKKPARDEQTAGIKLLTATNKGKSTLRPPNNPGVPERVIELINMALNDVKTTLDDYAQHLRSLDRKRLNGVGVKKLGFVERAYEIALENSEFLPHYITIERFGEDIQYFMDFRSLVDITEQVREKLWNITMQSSDIAYTDALEFYASVREAAKRRVDAAESIFHELARFFKSLGRKPEEEPTEKQAKRDFNALLHGKHDGKLVIENIKPKLSGGKRKIVDQTFKDTEEFKESFEGEIKE